MKLAGDRLALHAQLQVVLLLVPFRVQGDQADVDVRLRNALHAQVQVSADLVSGFHIPFHANAGNAQRLPAQVIGGNVSQQLRRVYRAAHLQEPLRRTAQARQGVIQIRRVDGGVQIEIFHPQLAFDIRRVAAQRHVQTRDNPLQVAVAFHRAFNVYLVLLHVPGELDLRHVHLPRAAVQAAAGFDQAIQLRRPVRHLFGGVNARQLQLAAPADRLLPVEQRGQLGFAFQRRDGQLVEVNLLFVALRIQGDVRGRHALPLHCGAERERIVGHLAAQLQLQVIGLVLFFAGEWPVKLLADHLKIERQPGFRQLGLRTQDHVHRAGEIDPDVQLLAQRPAYFDLHLLAFERVDVQGAIQRDIHRPVVA